LARAEPPLKVGNHKPGGRLPGLPLFISGLGETNIADGGLTRPTIRFGLVLDLLTFCQAGYSGTLQRGDMNENIWSTAVWLDEAKTPFD
jgi:hypothetical protein